ncbi:BspA family leucine-rich repeat surface protein [Psittacicella hinzii]|nr:BspA family leucine-rich repeat surface protein [Psittacicella hinzii]
MSKAELSAKQQLAQMNTYTKLMLASCLLFLPFLSSSTFASSNVQSTPQTGAQTGEQTSQGTSAEQTPPTPNLLNPSYSPEDFPELFGYDLAQAKVRVSFTDLRALKEFLQTYLALHTQEYQLMWMRDGQKARKRNQAPQVLDLNFIDVSQMTSLQGLFAFATQSKLPDDNEGVDLSGQIEQVNTQANVQASPQAELAQFSCDYTKDLLKADKQIDISQWDVSQVTNLDYLFLCSAFAGDISQWNVSKVTSMRGTFMGAQQFNSDLSQWNTAQVTDMSYMFYQANQFTSDLSSWNVGKVRSMAKMFAYASSFNSDLSHWQVNKVTDMTGMFYQAQSFKANLNNWQVENVKDVEAMFVGSLLEKSPQNVHSWLSKLGVLKFKQLWNLPSKNETAE